MSTSFHFIRNQGTGPEITSYNPATGEPLATVRGYTTDEAREALTRARRAQKDWARLSVGERAKILKNFQYVLTDRMEEVCELIMMENGKPMQEALETEVLPIIDLTAYFCGKAEKILQDQKISLHLIKYRRSFINYRPRGVMLIISPWNFPFTIPVGGVVMGLLAGNAILHKPASLTPLIALKTRELMDEAGIDPDLYQVIPGAGPLGSEIIEMGVDYVNFTGSTAVGKMVAATCGRKLIPCSMELGGKDPLIVTEDADLDLAAGAIVWGAFANAGQVCASVERVYARAEIYDALLEKVVTRAKALRVGNPVRDEVDMGAMVDPHQLEIVDKQVQDAIAQGAKVLVGGKRGDGPGQFFEPTVLVDVEESMDVVKEESFGPLLPMMKVYSDEEAIERSNNSIYGLNAYVYCSSPARARSIARRLEAGTVMINEVLITHACPETPWQGAKQSGTSKVHSDQGLRDLCFPYHINEEIVPQPSWSPFWQPYSQKMFETIAASVRTLYAKGAGGKLEGLKSLFRIR